MKDNKKIIKVNLNTSVMIIVFIMFLSIITIFFLTESLEKEKERIENSKNVEQTINEFEIKNQENTTKKEKNNKKESKTKDRKSVV